MQPLLGALELKHIAEETERIIVRDAQDEDLDQLDDVLDDVEALNDHAHSTQKPEALLYRVIMSSSSPGDVVLDPFFGSGTTGAVAKKLHRRWIGIERDPGYVKLAQERIDKVQVDLFSNDIFSFTNKRDRPRLAFGALLEMGLLRPGQLLYFDRKREVMATVLANGTITWGETTGSIHEVGRAIRKAPCNGWDHWYYEDPATGQWQVIDTLREQALALRAAHPPEEAQPVA